MLCISRALHPAPGMTASASRSAMTASYSLGSAIIRRPLGLIDVMQPFVIRRGHSSARFTDEVDGIPQDAERQRPSSTRLTVFVRQ